MFIVPVFKPPNIAFYYAQNLLYATFLAIIFLTTIFELFFPKKLSRHKSVLNIFYAFIINNLYFVDLLNILDQKFVYL